MLNYSLFLVWLGGLSVAAAQDVAQRDAVGQVSVRLTGVRTARAQFAQRLEVDKEAPVRMTFVVAETDGKGKTTDETYFLNAADLDPASVTYKVDKDVIVVEAETRQKRKFIRYSENGQPKGFTDRLKLYAETTDAARALTEALRRMTTTAEKNSAAVRLPDSLEGLTLWLKSNTGPETIGNDKLEQRLTFDGQNPLRVTLTVNRTDAKGTAKDNDEYGFNIADLDPAEVKLAVKGDGLELALGTRNRQKFIGHSRLGKADGNVNVIEIISADVDRIRAIEAAWRQLIPLADRQLVAQRPTIGSLAEIQQYIGGAITATQTGEKTFEQTIRTDCICTFTRKQITGRTTTENVYTLNAADLNEKELKLRVDNDQFVLTLPLRNRQRYIGYIKNGVRQNYTNELDLMGNDLERMRYLPSAFERLAQLCSQSPRRALLPGNTAALLAWLAPQMSTFRNNTEEFKQTLTADEVAGTCQFRFTAAQTGRKTIESVYRLHLKDLNADLTDFTVNGQNVFVNLFTNGREKAIKTEKDGKPSDYVNTVRIQIDDIEKARDVTAAFRQLIKTCSVN